MHIPRPCEQLNDSNQTGHRIQISRNTPSCQLSTPQDLTACTSFWSSSAVQLNRCRGSPRLRQSIGVRFVCQPKVQLSLSGLLEFEYKEQTPSCSATDTQLTVSFFWTYVESNVLSLLTSSLVHSAWLKRGCWSPIHTVRQSTAVLFTEDASDTYLNECFVSKTELYGGYPHTHSAILVQSSPSMLVTSSNGFSVESL